MNTPPAFGDGHALDAVDAAFEFQLGEHAGARDVGDDFLEAADFAGVHADRLNPPTLLGGEFLVHAIQVTGEQCSLVAAGPGANFEHRRLVVGAATREQRDGELAFAFGERGAQIEYIAPLRGHELTTRAELLRDEADHPRAREEYYKLQIGALEKLKSPITTEKWRRITFFYSTGEYILNARTLADLIVRDDERALLWKSLRERAQASQYPTATDLPEAELPPEVLMALLGIRDLAGDYKNKET